MFSELKSVQKLRKLSQKATDLTLPQNFTAERLREFCIESCNYKLLYATERVDQEILQTLFDLADETHAIAKMEKMQSGEIVNFIEGYPSEQRPALHTATRDFFGHRHTAIKAQEAAKLAYGEVEKLKKFLKQLEHEKYTDMILIGIGGSDLGPEAHYEALLSYLLPERKVHFIRNVDPDDAAQALHQLNLEQTLVVVISKTGTTLETMTNEALVRSYFEKSKVKQEGHFLSVTMPGTPLDDPKKYRETFYIWDWIGGRYSTTSMVGGVILGFAFGFDHFWQLLHGANVMDKAVLHPDPKKNLPLFAALLGIWNRNFLKYATLGIIPYCQALHRFPAHIQQLDMESNGKQIDKEAHLVDFETGPIIFGEPGTNAQHSFYQLIHQGTTVVPLELIGYKETGYERDIQFQGTNSQQKLLANLFAQMIALAAGQKSENPNKNFKGNRPSHLLLARKLTPFTLGTLLAFYEHKVAFQGFIWNINSFDQEGVQLGKVLANKIISRFAEPSGEPYLLGDALMDHLERL